MCDSTQLDPTKRMLRLPYLRCFHGKIRGWPFCETAHRGAGMVHATYDWEPCTCHSETNLLCVPAFQCGTKLQVCSQSEHESVATSSLNLQVISHVFSCFSPIRIDRTPVAYVVWMLLGSHDDAYPGFPFQTATFLAEWGLSRSSPGVTGGDL